MAPEEGPARERSDGGGLLRIDAKPEGKAYHGNTPIDALGASSARSQAVLDATGRAHRKIDLTPKRGRGTMGDMEKSEKTSVRLSKREKGKIDECAAFMGVSSGEFLRRCVQVMLSVMGDEESKAAIHQILEEATGTMKMGAGLQPVPPKAGVTGTPPLITPRGRKGKAGR